MANISDKITQIKQAIFGKDVRESIASGIEVINIEVESTTEKQELLETEFDQMVINAGNSNAEIVQARVDADGKTYVNLQERMNTVDLSLAENVQQISDLETNKTNDIDDTRTTINKTVTGAINELNNNKADKTQVTALEIKKADQAMVDAQFATIVSGSPKETFFTLAALQSAYPSGEQGTFLVLADGHWYYWNSITSSWSDGGVYQANGIGKNSVTSDMIRTIQIGNLNNELKKDFSKQFYQLNIELNGWNVDGSEYISNARARTTDFIEVSVGDEIINRPVLGNGTKFLYNIIFFDGNNKAISMTDYITENYTFTENARIKIVFKIASGSALTQNAPLNIMQGVILNKLQKYDKYISKYKNNLVRCIVNNAKVEGSGLVITYDATYYCIALVEIEGNTQYKANKFRTINFFDENFIFISTIPTSSISINNTITSPVNAKYMTYSLQKTDVNSIDDIYCTKLSDYKEGIYIENLYLEKDVTEKINTINAKINNIDKTMNYLENSFVNANDMAYMKNKIAQNEGLNIVILGDSTEAGVGFRYDATAYNSGYAELGDISYPPSLEQWSLNMMFKSPFMIIPSKFAITGTKRILKRNRVDTSIIAEINTSKIFERMILKTGDTTKVTIEHDYGKKRSSIAIYYLGKKLGAETNFTVTCNGVATNCDLNISDITYGTGITGATVTTIQQDGMGLKMVEIPVPTDVDTFDITFSNVPTDVNILGIYYGKPITFKNLAIRGTAITNNLQRNLDKGINIDERIAKALSYNPDVVIIGWGTNDYNVDVSPESVANSYKERIEQLRAYNPNIVIIIKNDYNNENIVFPGFDYVLYQQGWELLKEAAKETKCNFIDFSNYLNKYVMTDIMYNYCHPNEYGHSLMSEFMMSLCDYEIGWYKK